MARDLGFHVPTEHQQAAALICDHLVSVRGGALFLSNADAVRLLGWLDRAVPVPSILLAIEQAWQKRQQKRSRLPLTLGQAHRYLGKPCPGAFAQARAEEPRGGLEPLLERIRVQIRAGDPLRAALIELGTGLASLEQGADQRVQAMARVTAFNLSLWQDLPEGRKAEERAAARAELGDLANLDRKSVV